MAYLKVCRICLNTDTKMVSLDEHDTKQYYEEIMGFSIDGDSLPKYACYECGHLLKKYHNFKEKCYCGQKLLNELLWSGLLTYEAVHLIDRTAKNLKSCLEISPITDNVQSIVYSENQPKLSIKTKKFKSKKSLRLRKKERSESLEILNKEQEEKDSYLKIELDIESDDQDFLPENILSETESIKTSEYKKNKRKTFTSKTIKIKKVQRKIKVKDTKSSKYFDPKFWNKQILKEEEAIQVFKARLDEPKFVRAPYKCMDCYKGFSKEEMLLRHKRLRHSESLGIHECRYCKMRFKWDSHLKRHMREHYTKYQCLRCDFVCPLENTALFHEEYHSGVKRTCVHCGKEFKHSSTYYTHVRKSHRSEYICTVCGVSFVSDLGLQRHKKLKHLDIDGESFGLEEEESIFCDKCNMHFGTKQAYDEHFFHSLMHTEDKVMSPKKDLESERNDKTGNDTVKTVAAERIRPNKPKRKRKFNNPTSCHQCGATFDTQLACMKHHKSAHPGTAFTPANQRRICEICGLSLAPGSVASHKNTHTKEKVYSCSTCGRQFVSPVSLKRHYLTHTGEKPFACSLCDKRFTQSNSCKLHYRTFHLKQPYPPRSRHKKDLNEPQLDMIVRNIY